MPGVCGTGGEACREAPARRLLAAGTDAHGIDGFTPIASLNDLGYFARQRMEFVKRLDSQKHGIYHNASAPLGGKVHVVGVGRECVIRNFEDPLLVHHRLRSWRS